MTAPTGIWTPDSPVSPEVIDYTRPILERAMHDRRPTVTVSGIVWTFTAFPSAPDHRLPLTQQYIDDQQARHLRADVALLLDRIDYVNGADGLDIVRRIRAVLSEATPSSEPQIDVDRLARAMFEEGIAPFRSRSKAEAHGFEERYRRKARDLIARLSASQTPEADIQ